MHEAVQQLQPYAALALAIIGWFIVRTLRQIDRSQVEQWKHIDEMEQRLSILQGEHNALMRAGGCK